MKKILILSNESGGGHKQTAHVLSQALQQDNRQIKTVSLFQELLLDLDYSAKFIGVSGEDIYNKFILQNEASHFFYKFFFFSVYYSFVVPHRKHFAQRFADFFEREKPDLVISVIPILNREIAHAIHQRCPFLIIQTDLFEYEEQSWFWRWLVPCGAWFITDKTTYMASGTEKGYQQALRYQPDKSKVISLSGAVIDPRFLQHEALDIDAERKKLGLKPGIPIGLCLYGGHPPKRVLKLAKQLNKLKIGVQLIFICGRNEGLQKHLNSLSTRYEKIVMGYSKEVPYYMQIADFLVGKPGPGTIMESIALGLPVLLDSSHVMPHEVDNASWVEEQHQGLQFKTAQQLHACIQSLNEPNGLMAKKPSPFENRAVFEIGELVEQILLE